MRDRFAWSLELAVFRNLQIVLLHKTMNPLLIDRELYQVSAIPIRDRSMLLNLFVDMIICLVVFFLLQKLPHEGGHEKRLRRWGFVLTLFLSFVLWANILSRWDDGAYRFLYLVAVLLEILLVLIAIIKGAVVCLNLMKKLRNAGFAE